MTKISLHLILLLLLPFHLNARQIPETGKDSLNSAEESQRRFLHELYNRKVVSTNELINGKEYTAYYYKSKQKPILFEGEKHSASIVFNDREYRNINLDYDTYLDEVIYTDDARFINYNIFRIALNSNPVSCFVLNFGNDSLLFRWFSSSENANFNLPEGFYEIAYGGKSKFIIRHRSILMEKVGLMEYIYSRENYIMTGDSYIRISSPKSFFTLFGDKSDKIRKFVRTNKIDIRRGDKKQIADVMRYYDSLSGSNLPRQSFSLISPVRKRSLLYRLTEAKGIK